MKANQWYGRRFSQWIELQLRNKFSDEWMLNNPPVNFEVLQNYAQRMKFDCSDYEYHVANKLRSLGIPIDHQVIFFNRYIADLALCSARTIIEIDGLYHRHEFQKSKDDNRDKVFISFDFDVHRWPTSMNQNELAGKITNFFKAYKKHIKKYHLRPLCRPSTIEKMSQNGMIQKAPALKGRN